MILKALKDMAETSRLTEDLNYEPKRVPWVISITSGGRFTGVISTSLPEGPKNRPVAKTMRVPRRKTRTSGNVSDFLVDKPEYVLGILPVSETESKKPSEKTEIRRLLFRAEVAAAFATTSEFFVGGILAFLDNENSRAACAAEFHKLTFSSSDLICFEVDGELAHEAQSVRRYFASQRQSDSGPSATCLVCGAGAPPIANHPLVQVRGGAPVA